MQNEHSKISVFYRISRYAFLCILLSSFYLASGNALHAKADPEAYIFDYKPLAVSSDVRRREAGLSKEEKEEFQGTGSTTRGTVRGAARGTVRGTARGAARGTVRGVARGTVRGEIRGVARGSVRGEVRGTARGEVRGAARGSARGTVRGTGHGDISDIIRGKHRESQIEAIYAGFKDTLYLSPDRIEPIAPRGIGYASDAQPTLYFYMNKPSSKPIEFTLNRKDELDPVVVSYIHVNPDTGVLKPDIHSISLEELGVKLEENVEYEWFVTIVMDVVERSGDIVASGVVVHQEGTELNTQPLMQGFPQYSAYSLNGYWYDAVDAAMSLRDETTKTSIINRQLIHWLKKEKLPSTCSFLSGS